jgi:glycine/D-amino acid oxidase-like deaminating enzyme
VIDDDREDAPSRIAAGVINPVTGRRYVTTWMIDEVMPFAVNAYRELGDYLDTKLVWEKPVIEFFTSPQMLLAFTERITEDDTYVHAFPDQNHFNRYFSSEFGCGEIRPSYTVNISLLLAAWKKKLIDLGALRNENFRIEELDVNNEGVRYNGIDASKVLFCDGVAAAENPWFSLLPFAPNKGEALIIECRDIPHQHIFKKGMMLVPLPVEHTFWVGSAYEWEFSDDQPSEAFRKRTVSLLDSWLKFPYRILFHKASVRPATLERRPFVGLHPANEQLGILNGMGTKGVSLAPFFAFQLAEFLSGGLPITPEADVKRFSRLLSK